MQQGAVGSSCLPDTLADTAGMLVLHGVALDDKAASKRKEDNMVQLSCIERLVPTECLSRRVVWAEAMLSLIADDLVLICESNASFLRTFLRGWPWFGWTQWSWVYCKGWRTGVPCWTCKTCLTSNV